MWGREPLDAALGFLEGALVANFCQSAYALRGNARRTYGLHTGLEPMCEYEVARLYNFDC